MILINAELAAREMSQVSLEQGARLVILYAEQGEERFEKAAVRWLGMLLLEKPMPISLAAQCVELVSQLRGPEAERVGKALAALAGATSGADVTPSPRLGEKRTSDDPPAQVRVTRVANGAIFCKSPPGVPEGGGPSVSTGHMRG